MSLSRDDILGADDLARVEVDAPEWGGSVWVRTLNLCERLAMEAAVQADPPAAVAAIVAAATCDESGVLVFRPDDVFALKGKNAAPLVRIVEAAKTLNKISTEDVKELQGNSEASPSDDSHFGSRHILG